MLNFNSWMYTLLFFFAKKIQNEGANHADSLTDLGTNILVKYNNFYQHAHGGKKCDENKVYRNQQ